MNCNYQAVSSIPALIILPDKKGTAQLWHPIQSVWGKTHMEWELIIDIWYSDVWGCFFFCSGAFIFEILLPKPPRGSRDADAISVCRLWLKRQFGGKGCNFDTCTWINRRGPRVEHTTHVDHVALWCWWHIKVQGLSVFCERPSALPFLSGTLKRQRPNRRVFVQHTQAQTFTTVKLKKQHKKNKGRRKKDWKLDHNCRASCIWELEIEQLNKTDTG